MSAMFAPVVVDGKVQVTDTPGLLAMARDAERRQANRQAKMLKLEVFIDPAGTHLLTFQMLHNNTEWRTRWLVKVEDSMQPVELWLNVSLGVFDAATRGMAVVV